MAAMASSKAFVCFAGSQTHAAGRTRRARVSKLPTTCAVEQNEAQPQLQHLAGLALGAACAFSVALTPLSAQAVAGGGGAGTPLRFQNFTNQDLSGKKYYKADMRGSDFSGANMQGANLFGALLPDAKFVGTDLTGASLESADLDGADMRDAILVGAQMTNAQMRGTNFDGADFTDVYFRRDVLADLCKRVSGTNPVTGVDTKESLMCN